MCLHFFDIKERGNSFPAAIITKGSCKSAGTCWTPKTILSLQLCGYPHLFTTPFNHGQALEIPLFTWSCWNLPPAAKQNKSLRWQKLTIILWRGGEFQLLPGLLLIHQALRAHLRCSLLILTQVLQRTSWLVQGGFWWTNLALHGCKEPLLVNRRQGLFEMWSLRGTKVSGSKCIFKEAFWRSVLLRGCL